jgi:hypothetical protein
MQKRTLIDRMKPLIWIVCLLASLHWARADQIALSPTADTTISDGTILNADGNAATYITGRVANGGVARALLRFSFGDIPAGSIVNSVSLTVNVERNHFGSSPPNGLYRLLVDWSESGATWNSSGFAPWTGGNTASTPDANAILGNPGSYTFGSTTALVATVQDWLTNSSSNFGWVLRFTNETVIGDALRIASGNSGGAPSLVIDYTPPAPPPPTINIASPRVADGKFIFDFVAEPGFSYVAQYKGALLPGDWTDFAWIPDPGVSTPTTVEDPLTTTNRFYRIVVATWP